MRIKFLFFYVTVEKTPALDFGSISPFFCFRFRFLFRFRFRFLDSCSISNLVDSNPRGSGSQLLLK